MPVVAEGLRQRAAERRVSTRRRNGWPTTRATGMILIDDSVNPCCP